MFGAPSIKKIPTNHLRDKIVHVLEHAGYVERTVHVNLNSICDFAAYHRRSSALLRANDVRMYRRADDTGDDRRAADSPAHRSAEVAVHKDAVKTRERLVSGVALGFEARVDHSNRLLAALTEPKVRVFFTLMYATGLRMRDAPRRETRDIQALRGVTHV